MYTDEILKFSVGKDNCKLADEWRDSWIHKIKSEMCSKLGEVNGMLFILEDDGIYIDKEGVDDYLEWLIGSDWYRPPIIKMRCRNINMVIYEDSGIYTAHHRGEEFISLRNKSFDGLVQDFIKISKIIK